MNTLEKFKLAEYIKDRYTSMFKIAPDSACSGESLDKTADLLVETIENFEDIKKDDGLQAGITYLVDVTGYYMALCEDILTHNRELVELLKQKGE